jgi:Transposase DDE domain
MEWKTTWNDPLTSYLEAFDGLIGDQRTRKTFGETVRGIIGAGSLICQQIAGQSPMLSRGKKGAQRVIRLAMGESTHRSDLDDRHLTARLREVAVEQLAQAPEEEVWLIADSSDLRKPYAEAMPYLMQVKDLQGDLVPGYRTINVIGVTPGRRGLLYHHLFSSQAPDFRSEPAEAQEALSTVSQALSSLKDHKTITWLLDSGFDDVAVWRTIWEAQEHLVCRVYQQERLVSFQDRQGQWREGNVGQVRGEMRKLARVQTTLVAKRGKQPHAKKQPVEVEVAACPLRVSYETGVRRKLVGKRVTREVWLGEVHILGTDQEPWLLLTDWPVTDEQSAARVFTMYRQRWGVEDSFKFLKTCLGWEEVQVLDWQALRTLVALAWVAAGFLYELGVSWDWDARPTASEIGRMGAA